MFSVPVVGSLYLAGASNVVNVSSVIIDHCQLAVKPLFLQLCIATVTFRRTVVDEQECKCKINYDLNYHLPSLRMSHKNIVNWLQSRAS